MRLVTERVTKIVNVPNIKDHGATGVTGCLKNIAYGSFSNVARTHAGRRSHTYSRRSGSSRRRTAAVAHRAAGDGRAARRSGTAVRSRGHERYALHPHEIMFGTDPVAIDRLLLDIIDQKRRARGALDLGSIARVARATTRARDADPNVNIIIREPGHVEFASSLGLGVHDRARIKVEDVTV